MEIPFFVLSSPYAFKAIDFSLIIRYSLFVVKRELFYHWPKGHLREVHEEIRMIKKRKIEFFLIYCFKKY